MSQLALRISHYFLPGYSNDHRAKILHPSTLFIISFLLISYQFVIQAFSFLPVRVLGYAANISVSDVISMTNQKRTEQGLNSLNYSADLERAAKAKGEDMLTKDYWAHVAPDGTQPWKFFTDVGYKYRYAGENLARDFTNASSTVDAWMASPSHRENLLSSKYTDIGVAVVEGDLNGVDTTIIIQLFGTRLSGEPSEQIPVAQAKTSVSTQTPVPTIVPTQPPLAIVTAVPAGQTEQISPPSKQIASYTQAPKSLLSPFQSTKGLSIAITVVLLAVTIVDAIVVWRKKIPRVGGRVFAHMAFLGMVVVIVLIIKAGSIL